MYNKSMSTNKLKQTIIFHFYIYELKQLKSNNEAPH